MADRQILIRGGTILDGTGAPARVGDVLVEGARILRVGERLSPGEGTAVIPAEGLLVCPGFIDAHCHTDMYALSVPDACGKAMQGVTTDVCGLCGDSPAPVGPGHLEEFRRRREYGLPGDPPLEVSTFAQYRERLDREGNSTNMALFVGNSNLRIHAVGYENREATKSELEQMKDMLRQSMEEGAFGLSTGLTYVPSLCASREELVELSRAMAPYGGIYNSHMRNEGDRVEEAIREVIHIARHSGCRGHISHLKVSGRKNHGRAQACLDLIHAARDQGVDISFDVYPYTAGSCGLRTLISPDLLEELDFSLPGGVPGDAAARLRRRLTDGDWDNLMRACGGDQIILASGAKEFVGWSIRDIAAAWDLEEAETILQLLLEAGGQGTIIYRALDEGDLLRFMKDPLCSIGTDAFARNYTGPTAAGCPHPRNYGAFPRWLRQYVLEGGHFSLEEGVRKITSLPARQFGLEGRGELRPGFAADLTLVDPDTVAERGDFLRPAQAPDGIAYVMVAGRLSVERGRFCPVKAGRMLAPADFKAR